MRAIALLLAFVLCTACESARLPVAAGTGPAPTLPPPSRSLIPTVSIAPATGWPAGVTPTPASGLAVAPFASGLDHPRWLYVLPNGDVLVAETAAPPRKPQRGIKAWFMRHFMKKAGAAVPSANRITLLRDADGDGTAEVRSLFLGQLNSPFGTTLVGNDLYVANTDALLRFRYDTGTTTIASAGERIVELPAGEINYHWTKNVVASADGKRLYVTVGSNSNVGEKGLEHEVDRAAILEVDPALRTRRVYASGLRNPVGLAWNGNALWTTVNERDELGSDLVPDFLTRVRDGGFYGWPYSYFGSHVDARVEPPRPDLVRTAIVPDYALGPHTASLGLTFAAGNLLPERFRNGAFIGQHGSWNRRPRSGYKVIFVPFVDGMPSGAPLDVLTGFLSEDGKALGRPVGVAIDKAGALLVADDVGDTVWRITAAR